MKLEGKVVIVTGGSSGIGESVVRLFHSRKSIIIIADRNIADGEKLKQELGKDVHFIETDVSKEESIKSMIDQTVALFKVIHIVINSAGVAWAEPTANPKMVHKSDHFTNVFIINVLGTFNVCKYAAQHIMKQDFIDEEKKEKAVFINIASIAAYEGSKGTVAYAGSKGAVIAMTLPMARDLGKYGIRVMCLAPSIILTPMGKLISDKNRETLAAQTCFGRLGKANELADMCEGIVENSYLTGDTWRIDGGMRGTHI